MRPFQMFALIIIATSVVNCAPVRRVDDPSHSVPGPLGEQAAAGPSRPSVPGPSILVPPDKTNYPPTSQADQAAGAQVPPPSDVIHAGDQPWSAARLLRKGKENAAYLIFTALGLGVIGFVTASRLDKNINSDRANESLD